MFQFSIVRNGPVNFHRPQLLSIGKSIILLQWFISICLSHLCTTLERVMDYYEWTMAVACPQSFSYIHHPVLTHLVLNTAVPSCKFYSCILPLLKNFSFNSYCRVCMESWNIRENENSFVWQKCCWESSCKTPLSPPKSFCNKKRKCVVLLGSMELAVIEPNIQTVQMLSILSKYYAMI